ncbi:DUF4251 domain-containing protein [Pedobacter rhodius]|uniref:DUF4251 domain-containing protein n=1 Tax=Pedobacter rhodius TaxID=3004098 RepID=A0ABT4L2C7_9SPHI|nr:DUF4251 domain-containing protein [Pedobacter sp. SJ11]MCZ4225350.1 DUF4251 domain-containing protein [Pedobacter sp. SJ11]
MKHLKLLSILFFVTIAQTFAQTNKETTKKIVADKNYVFMANTALPMSNQDISQVLRSMQGVQGGGTINLSGSQYDLKVTADSIVAYLPYYGRAYSAPYNPTDGGIKFTSKDFTYTESKNKKGLYIINIRTKDLKNDNYQIYLSISQNGYASLMMNSNNKQSITFNGVLEESKK